MDKKLKSLVVTLICYFRESETTFPLSARPSELIAEVNTFYSTKYIFHQSFWMDGKIHRA